MIRTKLALGTLPHGSPVRLRARRGSGQPCSACGEPIVSGEPEFEPQFSDTRAVLLFHAKCYSIWDAERYPEAS